MAHPRYPVYVISKGRWQTSLTSRFLTADGVSHHCTLLINAFMMNKAATMTMRGGNTDDLYAADGRAAMARSLERMWPGIVKVTRKYGRPHHIVNWRAFNTPLQLRDDAVIGTATNEYGMKLREVRPVTAPRLRALLDQEPDD